jgi:hypothetical protein
MAREDKTISQLLLEKLSSDPNDYLIIDDSADLDAAGKPKTKKIKVSNLVSGGGSGGISKGIALIDSTYSSNDASAHTYKDLDVAISSEDEETLMIFQQDGQTFTISSPVFLKLGQKFVCGFQPSSGITISCQANVISTASLASYNDRSTSNIIGAGIIMSLDGCSTFNLALRDSFVTFNHLLFCSNHLVYGINSEFTMQIDSGSPDVNLGFIDFEMNECSFDFTLTSDNASYLQALVLTTTGDAQSSYISVVGGSGVTQYINALQFLNYSSVLDGVDLEADEIYIGNYGTIMDSYFYSAYISIQNFTNGKFLNNETELIEYVGSSPSRKTKFINLVNDGEVYGLSMDISASLSLPNSTHNFNELISMSCSGDSKTHIIPAITVNGNFSNTNFTNFAGIKIADIIVSDSSEVEFEGTRFNKDVFYTTPEYFTITSNTQYNANNKSPKLTVRGDLLSSSIVDFGNTVIGTIDSKTLIEVENTGLVMQPVCLDVFTDEITVTRSSGSDASTRNFSLLNCDDPNYLANCNVNVNQLKCGISDLNFYVSESSDSKISINYYDDFNSDCVLYLNGVRNNYKFFGTEINGTVRQASLLGLPDSIKIEDLNQGLSYTIDLYCDIDNVVIENCVLNDLTIDTVSNCIGYGNVVNGTYTDNGIDSRFFNTCNIGCADIEDGAYTEDITNPGSWSDGGTYYYVDINHALGVNDFNVELWEDDGSDYQMVLAEVYQVSKSISTCQIRVSKTPDNRFTGKVNIISRGSIQFSSASGGDMRKAIYDPFNVNDDVFDMDNMSEGTTNKILTNTSQSIDGTKTFTSFPVTPSSAPILDYQVANKKYVDSQTGGVVQVECYNDTGVTIPKGKVVTPDNARVNTPTIVLANADNYDESRFIGITVADIPDGTSGFVYVFGTITNINTSGLNVGPAYLTTDGNLTSTQPTGGNFYITVGFVVVSNATTGVIVVNPSISNITMEVLDTNGFPADQRAATTLSFDDVTRTFTIAPTGASFYYYEKGIKYIKTAPETFTIGALEEGPHAIYFDGNTISDFYNPTPDQYNDIIRNNCLITGIYWDATNAKAIYLADHRYGINMSPATHVYLSSTVGIEYISGIGLNTINATGDGSVDSHAQFGVDVGQLINKDLFYDTSAIASTTGLNIFYFDTAFGLLRQDTNTGFSVLTAGTGRLAYNQYTGGAYQLTECTDGYYTLCHIIANADVNHPVTAYLGLNEFATLAEARNAAKSEIYDVELMLTRTEVVPIATIIFQTDDTYTNAVKARIVEFETGVSYKNHVSEIDVGTLESHDDLSGVNLAASGISFGHINDGAQTIAGVKTLEEFAITPSSAPTTDYQVVNKKYVDDIQGYYDRVVVINNTGVTIPKGKIVTPTGESGGYPEVELACPKTYSMSRFVGMTNEDILDGATGEVYIYGAVENLDTSSLSVGAVYLDDDGSLTSDRPTGEYYTIVLGFCMISNATNGIIVMDGSIAQLTTEVTDTNGFPLTERDATTISFTDGTRTFTIAPTGADFHFYQNGQKYIKTSSQSVGISNTEGIHVIYFDNGTLTALANPTDAESDAVIRTKCIVAFLYWDATNGEAIYLGDERHGISMSPETHSYLHFSRGAQFLNGLGLNDFVIDDGDVDTHAQFSSASGFITDEDLLTSISAVASTTGLPIYYLDGANGYLRRITNSGFSVLDDVTAGVGVTGRLVYNEWTGAAWQLSTVGNNDFVLCHVFAVNSNNASEKMVAFIGQADYGSLALARSGVATEISSLITQIPIYEIVPIATIIFQTGNGYANAVKARVVLDTNGNEYTDFRTSELAQGANPSSHANLTGVEQAGTGVTDGHISDQTQTLYGVKTFNSFAETPSSAPTTDYQVANKKYVDDQIDAIVIPCEIGLALSDETTDLTTGTVDTFVRLPHAMTLTEVRINVGTAPVGADLIVDVKENGTTVFSTKVSIDDGEDTSTTATTPAVISDSALGDDSKITFSIDQIGSSTAGAGLKIWLIGTRTI